jgi:hypothetical protein
MLSLFLPRQRLAAWSLLLWVLWLLRLRSVLTFL